MLSKSDAFSLSYFLSMHSKDIRFCCSLNYQVDGCQVNMTSIAAVEQVLIAAVIHTQLCSVIHYTYMPLQLSKEYLALLVQATAPQVGSKYGRDTPLRLSVMPQPYILQSTLLSRITLVHLTSSLHSISLLSTRVGIIFSSLFFPGNGMRVVTPEFM